MISCFKFDDKLNFHLSGQANPVDHLTLLIVKKILQSTKIGREW